ncbi:MAG TPA: DUF6036 family nucleotidyltransferase [Xanthomonadaceae bacterium]|nr:DUF6036 family nucleotidyltransferase [Xanthomonadaceae bacterium]
MAFRVHEIFHALAQADARYVVVGGLAVILHGHLRATRDLDLVISLEQANCAKALRALSGIGLRPRLPVPMEAFSDPSIREQWHRDRNMEVFQLWDPANEERSVDLFVHEPIDFEELYGAAVTRELHGVPIRVAAIHHLIRMKRLAGRPRDLDDIAALRQIAAETGQPTE